MFRPPWKYPILSGSPLISKVGSLMALGVGSSSEENQLHPIVVNRSQKNGFTSSLPLEEPEFVLCLGYADLYVEVGLRTRF